MWHEKLATMSVLSGTHTPARCPAGTYSNGTGLVAEYQCTNCTAGYYCQNTGLTSEQGLCQAGYYCPQGEGGMAITAYKECVCVWGGGGMATTAHKVVWGGMPTR